MDQEKPLAKSKEEFQHIIDRMTNYGTLYVVAKKIPIRIINMYRAKGGDR